MGKRETGATPLADGEQVAWVREEASAEQVLNSRHRAAAATYRVRTVQERPDESGRVTTYSVPGAQLGMWLAELQGRREDEAETILSVEALINCPECDIENQPSATSCVGCGSRLEPLTIGPIRLQQWLPKSVPPVLRKAGLGYCSLGCGLLLLIVLGWYLLSVEAGGKPIGEVIRQLMGRSY